LKISHDAPGQHPVGTAKQGIFDNVPFYDYSATKVEFRSLNGRKGVAGLPEGFLGLEILFGRLLEIEFSTEIEFWKIRTSG
jgi:hypothetical protein